ncbi:MAG: DUF1937 family protein [Gammaproteobacteria bacterium]|nr:DUF1937 family protein [Gammaproteobacteria bacterium]
MIGNPQKSIYLACPYTHEQPLVMQWRHDMVCRVAGELMKKGKIVFSPIAHTHNLANLCDIHSAWDETVIWKRQDLHWVKACDEFGIVTLVDWSKSVGLKAEWAYAESIGKPCFYINYLDYIKEPA